MSQPTDADQAPRAATADAELSRVGWQCRRGMLELDLLLSQFLTTGFARLDAAGRADFLRLLGYPDQIIHSWLMGREPPADAELRRLVTQIWAATAKHPGDAA